MFFPFLNIYWGCSFKENLAITITTVHHYIAATAQATLATATRPVKPRPK